MVGAPSNDITGAIRPNPTWTNPDLGAYESERGSPLGQTMYHVSTSGQLNGSGTIDNPLLTIQSAINLSSDGDTIQVQSGVYTENLDFTGKRITLIGADQENTIIDGDQSGPVILLSDLVDGIVKIKGFTLKNGVGLAGTYSDAYLTSDQLLGGGILSLSNDLILEDLIIQENTAEYGGGVFTVNGNITINNVTLRDNSATNGQGGGLWSFLEDGVSKTVTIDSSLVTQNSSTHRGAGIAVIRGILNLIETEITYNETTENGGGVYIAQIDNSHISDCKIQNNAGSQGGGVFSSESVATTNRTLLSGNVAYEGSAIKLFASDLDIINCTIVDNLDGNFGVNDGHIFLHHSPNSLTLVNTIVSNDAEYEIVSDYPSTSNGQDLISIEYSMISGGNNLNITDNTLLTWGDGNLDIDPHFVDQENDDYRLLARSMLINSGDPSLTDEDGSRSDIGAFSFFNDYSGPVWYTAAGGSDITGTGSFNDPFLSIQSAINFSSDGDSVHVSMGYYQENLDLNGKAISLTGDGTGITGIVGDSTAPVILINDPVSGVVKIKGFDIRGGVGLVGGYPDAPESSVGGGIFALYNNVHLGGLKNSFKYSSYWWRCVYIQQ